MKAWEYHNQIIRRRKINQAREAVRMRETAVIDQSAEQQPEFDLLLEAVKQDREKLHGIPQGPERNERKRELVKNYLPAVEAYLAGEKKFRNPVLSQVMIWLFDLGDIDQAMRLARVAVEQNQPMPDGFKRDIRTGVADLVLDWVNTRENQPVEPYFSEIYALIFPAEGIGWQIHDDIKIKYIKIAIARAEAEQDVRKALQLCKFAESIDPKKAQVKTRKAQLEKAVAKLDEAAKYQ